MIGAALNRPRHVRGFRSASAGGRKADCSGLRKLRGPVPGPDPGPLARPGHQHPVRRDPSQASSGANASARPAVTQERRSSPTAACPGAPGRARCRAAAATCAAGGQDPSASTPPASTADRWPGRRRARTERRTPGCLQGHPGGLSASSAIVR